VLTIVLQYFGAVEEVKPLGEIPILEGTVVIKEPVRCISNVIAHSDSAQQRCQDLIDLMYAACSMLYHATAGDLLPDALHISAARAIRSQVYSGSVHTRGVPVLV